MKLFHFNIVYTLLLLVSNITRRKFLIPNFQPELNNRSIFPKIEYYTHKRSIKTTIFLETLSSISYPYIYSFSLFWEKREEGTQYNLTQLLLPKRNKLHLEACKIYEYTFIPFSFSRRSFISPVLETLKDLESPHRLQRTLSPLRQRDIRRFFSLGDRSTPMRPLPCPRDAIRRMRACTSVYREEWVTHGKLERFHLEAEDSIFLPRRNRRFFFRSGPGFQVRHV